MTIKQLADDLGVEKYRIKYLCDQLPPNYTVKVDNRLILSDAAVDAIRRKLSGGELVSEIPVTPYNKYDPVGWGISETTPENSEDALKNSEESSENIEEKMSNNEESVDKSEGFFEKSDFLRRKSGDEENRIKPENTEEATLTLIDLYKKAAAANDFQIRVLNEQLAVKDEQIKALSEQLAAQAATFTRASEAAEQRLSDRDAQVATLTKAVADRDRADNDATLAQLQAKDEQLKRLQDTVDALTRQLEQSREQPRRWWQWWKR